MRTKDTTFAMAHGYWLSAEYESGYILTEDENDRNPYSPDGNVFTAILNHLPTEAGHGRLLRFSLIPQNGTGDRYDIDWKPLWEVDNARPIYFRQMQMSRNMITGESTPATCMSHNFGYQYNAPNGDNVQKIEEIIN